MASKLIFCLLLMLSSPHLFAQVGEAAASSSQAGKNSSWQAWTFAGSAALTAALGIFVVSLDSGASQSH